MYGKRLEKMKAEAKAWSERFPQVEVTVLTAPGRKPVYHSDEWALLKDILRGYTVHCRYRAGELCEKVHAPYAAES